MDLSVVIVNYNVRYFLEQCLLSVRKAAVDIQCEVFVVDNNSADGSCAMVLGKFPEVILIRNRTNRGFSAACNQAITISKGRYILLLNPDTVVEEDTFNKCIAFMINNPHAGALGVKMINGNGKVLPESKRAFPTPSAAFFKMTGLSALFPKSKYFSKYYLGHLDDSATSEVDIISGAFMLITGEAIKKTGLLDESFFMYGEDIDLSYRLIKAGFRNYYYPEVKIIHYKGESTKKSDVNNIINFYDAMLIFADKHFEYQYFGFMKFLLRTAILVRGIISLLKNTVRRHFMPAGNLITRKKRTVIVSNNEDYPEILRLAEGATPKCEVIGRVSIISEDLTNEVLGNSEQIGEIIRVNRIREVIISTHGLNASEIINIMQVVSAKNVTIKIAPEGEKILIGSKSLSRGKTVSNIPAPGLLKV